MNKRYVLLTKTKSKYDDFYQYHYKMFENYFDLQKHLMKFWYIPERDYIVFVESKIKKDFSTTDLKKRRF